MVVSVRLANYNYRIIPLWFSRTRLFLMIFNAFYDGCFGFGVVELCWVEFRCDDLNVGFCCVVLVAMICALWSECTALYSIFVFDQLFLSQCLIPWLFIYLFPLL